MNENCTQCHNNDTNLFARQVQYQASAHYVNGNFERNGTSCAPCHTHEGFMEVLATGALTTAAAIDNPSPPNCRTCHQIHTTFTDTDYALTTTAPVALQMPVGTTVNFGEGNLCASCHQARPISPVPVIGGSAVTIAARYGTHHSPVANILGGEGLFEFTGSATIDGGPFTAHGGPNVGCSTCHMATAFGAQAGGHTFAMSYDYHGSTVDNIAACKGCHSSATNFGLFGAQADVQAMMDELAGLLRGKGILQDAPSILNNAGSFPANVAAAYVNWQTIEEDKSLGIHNPAYVRAVLTNTIEEMKK